jgi:hypothetical protein
MVYNWQQKDWPNFSYFPEKFEDYSNAFIKLLGETLGMTHTASSEQETSFRIEFMH